MSTNGGRTADEVLQAIADSHIELVHLQFTDVPGAIKSLTIPASRLKRAFDQGTWFDGSSMEGMARVAERDLYLRPDPSTFAILPWETTPTARLICDLCVPGGDRFRADPRAAIQVGLESAAELDLSYRVACEVEFFVFENTPAGPPVAIDQSGYFEMLGSRATALCSAAVEALQAFGIEVDATHHEVGPGQYEIDLSDTDALHAADGLVALKWTLRALARQAHLRVSFMPKPIESASGSGLHISQMLVQTSTGDNAFFDARQRYRLSDLGLHFVAGQLRHARGMCAVLAPLVNSYKRLSAGDEAPSRVTWAHVNRGALLRLPESLSGQNTRLELRAPDPSCNPYLALAVALRAGLDGVAQELTPPEPVEEIDSTDAQAQLASEIANPLPSTLGEAMEEMQWNPVVREALGQGIVERFLAAKEQEWLAYSRHISQWELDRYVDAA